MYSFSINDKEKIKYIINNECLNEKEAKKINEDIYGIIIFGDLSIYKGMIKNGLMIGKGIKINLYGEILEGESENGNFYCYFGKCRYKINKGKWENGKYKGIINYSFNEIYKGDIKIDTYGIHEKENECKIF